MAAKLLRGGPFAADIREGVAADVATFRDEIGYTPELAIVVAGAMTVLLLDAIKPTLLQRLEAAAQCTGRKPFSRMSGRGSIRFLCRAASSGRPSAKAISWVK